MSVRAGIRIEFRAQSRQLIAAVSRQDVQLAAGPRPGDTFFPGSVTHAARSLLPLTLRVSRVEHAPRIAGFGAADTEPLVVAIVEIENSNNSSIESRREAFEAEGWAWHDLT